MRSLGGSVLGVPWPAGRMLRGQDHHRLGECWGNHPRSREAPQANGKHPCVPSTELHFCLQSPWDALPGSSCSAGAWPLAAQVGGGYWGTGEPKINPGLYAPQETCSEVWGHPASSPTTKMWGLEVTLTSHLNLLWSPRCYGLAATQRHHRADASRAPPPR